MEQEDLAIREAVSPEGRKGIPRAVKRKEPGLQKWYALLLLAGRPQLTSTETPLHETTHTLRRRGTTEMKTQEALLRRKPGRQKCSAPLSLAGRIRLRVKVRRTIRLRTDKIRPQETPIEMPLDVETQTGMQITETTTEEEPRLVDHHRMLVDHRMQVGRHRIAVPW